MIFVHSICKFFQFGFACAPSVFLSSNDWINVKFWPTLRLLFCARTLIGQIHLPHLWICKYFMDDSSINFHDNVFLHFLPNIFKKWRKTLSWKFMDESSVKYLRICKWGRWIRPMSCLPCCKFLGIYYILYFPLGKNAKIYEWTKIGLTFYFFKFLIYIIYLKTA